MKKLQCIAYGCILLFGACSTMDKQPVMLSGTVEHNSKAQDGAMEEIYLFGVKEGKYEVIDTIAVIGNSFSFQFGIDEAGPFAVGSYPVHELFLSPGDKLELKLNPIGYTIASSNNKDVHSHYAAWNHLMLEFRKDMDFSEAPQATLKKIEPFLPQIRKFKTEVPDEERYKRYFAGMAPLQVDDILLNTLITPMNIYPERDNLPAIYKKIYQKDKFGSVHLYDFPFGETLLRTYMRYALFVKHDFYKERNPAVYDSINVMESKNLGDKGLAAEIALEEMVNRGLFGEAFEEKRAVYEPLLVSDNQKKAVEQYMAKNIDPFKAGTPSPEFKFVDIEGREVSLHQFNGKKIYIDLWATWCGPCKVQMPFLEKIIHQYKNMDIVFLSVSVDEKKQAWTAFLKKEKNSGLQLYAGGEIRKQNKAFFDFYQIAGIPRFILLDEEGKLIMYDAYRPSDDRLKEKLDKILG